MSHGSRRAKKHRGLSRLTKILLALGALVLVLFLALGALFLRPSSSGMSVAAGEYVTLTKAEVLNQVRVTGTVQPHRIESISTSLTGKVSELHVTSGDRVEEGQLLAVIDSSDVQRELDTQTGSQNGAVNTAQSQAQAARSQYEQFQKGLSNGTNSDIRAADSALKSAQEQEKLAQSDLTAKQQLVNSEDGAPSAQEIAAAESALRTAQQATKDAQVALTTAQEAAQTQLQSLEASMKEAESALTTAQTTSEKTLGQLKSDIESAQLKAPFAGVVMSVNAQAGAKPEGAIMKIGDDSKLTITTTVPESDIAKIEEGDAVTFTSGASGAQEYSGVVTHVSRIAGASLPGATSNSETAIGAGIQSGNQDFAVQIEVTGNRDGLYIGSSVKAQIITEQANDAMTLPVDAVFTNDAGKQSVIVAVPNGDKARLEERQVTTGVQNDVDIEITGGNIAEGDIVLTYAENYRSSIGQDVELLTSQAWG